MSIKHRILAAVAAGTMVASIGLAAAPAGAGILPIGQPEPCLEDCGDDTPWNDGPQDLTADLGDPDDPDVPVPADANFTG